MRDNYLDEEDNYLDEKDNYLDEEDNYLDEEDDYIKIQTQPEPVEDAIAFRNEDGKLEFKNGWGPLELCFEYLIGMRTQSKKHNLITVEGRPGTGKSRVMLLLTRWIFKKHKLEMSQHAIENTQIIGEEGWKEKLIQCVKKQYPIIILHEASLTMNSRKQSSFSVIDAMDIIKQARALFKKRGICIIVASQEDSGMPKAIKELALAHIELKLTLWKDAERTVRSTHEVRFYETKNYKIMRDRSATTLGIRDLQINQFELTQDTEFNHRIFRSDEEDFNEEEALKFFEWDYKDYLNEDDELKFLDSTFETMDERDKMDHLTKKAGSENEKKLTVEVADRIKIKVQEKQGFIKDGHFYPNDFLRTEIQGVNPDMKKDAMMKRGFEKCKREGKHGAVFIGLPK